MSRELIVGSQVPLSLQQFYLTKENLKIFYNLEGIPMKALEARSDTEWFGWVKSQITAHLFQISICYYPWGGGGAWNNTQSIVSTRLWIKYSNCIVLNRSLLITLYFDFADSLQSMLWAYNWSLWQN